MSGYIMFNTGRYYGPGGQTIEAELIGHEQDPDKPSGQLLRVVRFHDHQRGIYGQIKLRQPLLSVYVMAEYDAGRYECIAPFKIGDARK